VPRLQIDEEEIVVRINLFFFCIIEFIAVIDLDFREISFHLTRDSFSSLYTPGDESQIPPYSKTNELDCFIPDAIFTPKFYSLDTAPPFIITQF
jgi:hypothetical protein